MAAVILVGCKKESDLTGEMTSMLKFASVEEFNETRTKVMNMSEEERRSWEQSQGFKSYATKCNELLEILDQKKNISDEDILDLVNENSGLFFIREENGEKYLENYLEDSPYKYFVNESQMMQVETSLLKAFKDGYAVGCHKDIDKLKKAKTLDELSASDKFLIVKIIKSEKTIDLNINLANENKAKKDKVWEDAHTHELWRFIGQRDNNAFNSNRNVAKIYLDSYYEGTTQIGDFTLPDKKRWFIEGLVKSYHRAATIWYNSKRTHKYNIHTEWTYDNMPSTSGVENSKELNGILCFERVFFKQTFTSKPIEFKFTKFTGWASTPDTPKIIMPN